MLKLGSILFALALLGFSMLQVGGPSGCGNTVCTGGAFVRLNIGAGGFVTRLKYAADGAQLAISDSGGASPWFRSSYTQTWHSLTTPSSNPDMASFTARCSPGYCYQSFPGCDLDFANGNNNHNTIYFWQSWNQGPAIVYKSTNAGATFARTDTTTFPGITCSPNPGRLWGPRVAGSPNSANTFYINTPFSGIYYTVNGGTSWQVLSGINPQQPNHTSATSATSNKMNTGSLSFTMASSPCGITMFGGDAVQVWQTSVPTNQMTGNLTACTGANITVNVTNCYSLSVCNGTGSSITDWSIVNSSDQQEPGSGLIAFDPSDATGNTAYAAVLGSGVWRITSATSSPSVTQLTNTGAPTSFTKMYVDKAGTLWIVDNIGGDQGDLYRYLGGTWTTQLTDSGGNIHQVVSVAIDPATSGPCAGNVCAYAIISTGGHLWYTTTAQTAGVQTWTAQDIDSNKNTVTSTVIPWITWDAANQNSGNPLFFSANWLAFDPTQSNALYLGTGRDILKANPLHTGTAPTIWNGDETAGIENLDVITGNALPGGGIFFTAQDLPGWFMFDNVYPSKYGPYATQLGGYTNGCANGIGAAVTGTAGSSIGISATFNQGSTWTAFSSPGAPNGSGFGTCTFRSSTFWIWNASTNAGTVQGPYYSTDGAGVSWTACTFPGGITAGGGGWQHDQLTLPFNVLTQDSAGNVIIYNDGTGGTNGSAAQGFYLSTSGCAFTHQYSASALIGGAGVPKWIEPAPGVTGDFFAARLAKTSSGSLPDTSSQVWRTTAAGGIGTTWTVIPNVESIFSFGLGPAKPGSDGYPAFYCACYVNDGSGYKYGIWEIDNIDGGGGGAVYTNIDTADSGFPSGNTDNIFFLQPDKQTYGTIWGGFAGSGGFFRTVH